MKTTRTVLISLFVLITLFFVFRSAEAAPGSPAAWLRGGESASWNTDEEPYDQITAWTVSAVQAASQQGQSISDCVSQYFRPVGVSVNDIDLN